MRRISHKTCLFFSVFLVLFCATSTAFACDMPAIETRLCSRGYPPQVLCALSAETKRTLASSDSVFDAASLTYEGQQTLEWRAGQPSTVPLGGQISDKQLLLLLLVSTLPDHSIQVTLQYGWKKLPINRWQDCIGVTWDRNEFSFKEDTFQKTDMYYYRSLFSKEDKYAVHSNQRTPKEISPDYVVWKADLKGHSLFRLITGLSGSASFTLVPRAPSGRSQVFVHYAHAGFSGSVDLSCNETGSLDVTSGKGFSLRGTQADVEW